VIDIEHHDGQGAVLAAGGVKFAVKELLHVAAVVKPGEGVADGLEAERLPKIDIGNRQRDVFRDSGGEETAASEGIALRVGISKVEGGRSRNCALIVILNDQGSKGVAIGDERNTDGGTFTE
jgi:hypothetical protein